MILLIDSQKDSSTDDICKWLLYFDKPFIRLNNDNKITSVNFDLLKDVYEIEINNIYKINLSDIKSVFYKNGDLNYQLNTSSLISDFTKKYHFEEWQILREFFKLILKNNKVKIIGNLLSNKVNKLESIKIAQSLKLNVPKTHIISSRESFTSLLCEQKTMVTKPLSEMKPLLENGGLYLNYTRMLSKSEKVNDYFAPSLLQEKIEKLFEIRSFFIDTMFWSIAIFSQENDNTKVDNRIYDFNNMNHICPFLLPKNIENKLIKLSKKLGLNSGSFDLIYSKNRKYYFLEINPIGIFDNVSQAGNYNIEKKIAEIL